MCPTRSVADKRRNKLYRRVGQRKDMTVYTTTPQGGGKVHCAWSAGIQLFSGVNIPPLRGGYINPWNAGVRKKIGL